MRGLDPRIHRKKDWFIQADGLHRNSGLLELRSIMRRKSGKPTCGVKPGNDSGWLSADGRRYKNARRCTVGKIAWHRFATPCCAKPQHRVGAPTTP